MVTALSPSRNFRRYERKKIVVDRTFNAFNAYSHRLARTGIALYLYTGLQIVLAKEKKKERKKMLHKLLHGRLYRHLI